jgi:phage shock protein C
MSNLCKNKEDGMFFGVCAGISDYTGIDVTIIRLLTLFGAIATGSIIFWVYLLLGILLPKKS